MRVPRLGVAAATALRCTGVVVRVREEGGVWTELARSRPIQVPLLSLGRRMCDAAANAGAPIGRRRACGRPPLRTLSLTEDLFEKEAMVEVDTKDLLEMTVTELKTELGARGESKAGNKAWLQRRLHSAILAHHIATRNRAYDEIFSSSGGESDGDDEGGGGDGE